MFLCAQASKQLSNVHFSNGGGKHCDKIENSGMLFY